MDRTISNKIVKIRKERECLSCLRKLPVGAEMNRWVGIYEGDFSTTYLCIPCRDYIQENRESVEDGIPEGFVNELREKEETIEQCLERISRKVKEKKYESNR